ncbi:MAG TPA: SPFH domain-containing protein [Candidatus Acidoferrales bacterium]|jgi:regulator of protease activity HflC (stomatin/prohibitin superfamily)|nr:SPFH domain-containing protein [Candidatus Acidoferrales bacterium]
MNENSLASPLLHTFLVAVGMFVASFILVPMFFGVVRFLGLYTIVEERQCKVYMLFGKVVAVIDEPGLHLLIFKLGLKAPLVNFLGKCHVLDLRLDQEYIRSTPVNSEEGAPMGIGIWYEMVVSDPVSYLFKNADPRGSLAANVGNSTVRCLSNMKLGDMLTDRHPMSQTVRKEVSPQSEAWGYSLGSVYIRKVHFRDAGMIKQIEEKVVNRLRQVTSAIKQDGTNQVNIIASTAEQQAAIEFAKAAAMRPQIVGLALKKISQDPDISRALFHVLETQNIIGGEANITLIPKNSGMLGELVAAQGQGKGGAIK